MEVTTTGLGSRDVEQFALELSRIKQRLDVIEVGLRTGQLGNSSVENGYLSFYDDDGIERARIGKQDDGTYAGGVNRNNNIPPQVPNTPVAEPVIAGVRIKSTGPTSGTWPADFSHINVWQADGPGLQGRVVGTILGRNVNGAQEVFIVAPLAAGTGPYRFWLTSVNLSKAESAPSDEVTASPLAVVGSDILAGAINELQLAEDAVTQAKIAAGAVGTAEIAGQAVDLSKLADGSVSAAQLIDGAVQTEKIAAGAIVSDLLAANAVIAGKVAANAITTVALAANAVSAEKVAAAAISAEKIAAEAVTAEKILALAITSDKIAANAISAGHIQAGAVTASKLEADMVIANRVIAGSATGARTELHPTNGLQAFTAAGLRTLWADSATGNLTAIGTFQTATTGQRLEILPTGTMRIYPASGVNYSELLNNSSQVILRGPLTGSNAGYLTMDSTFSQIAFGNPTQPNNSTASFTVQDRVITSTGATVAIRMDKRYTPPGGGPVCCELQHVKTDGTVQTKTTLRYLDQGSNDEPKFYAPYFDSGLTFANDFIYCNDSVGLAVDCQASAFVVVSQRAAKKNIRPLRDALKKRAVDVLRGARAEEFEYNRPPRAARPDIDEEVRLPNGQVVRRPAEWPTPERASRKHYSPAVEDLTDIAPSLVHTWQNPNGAEEKGVDVRDLAGMAWAGAAENADDIDELRAEIAALRQELSDLRGTK